MQRKTIHRLEEFEFIKTIYFSLCSVSFVLFRRIYYITPDNKSLSETLLLAALIVTGECRAKTIADNSNQKCNIYFPCSYFPRHIPRLIFPSPKRNNRDFKQQLRKSLVQRPKLFFSHHSPNASSSRSHDGDKGQNVAF